MSIIAEYSIGIEGLVFEHTVRHVDVELEVERSYATDPSRPILFVWACSDDFEALEAAMDEDPTVMDVQRFSTVEGRRLYRLQVTGEVDVVLYPIWVELGGEGLEATVRDGRWHSRVRFPDREALSEYESRLAELGVSIQLHRLYDASEGTGGLVPQEVLTDEQRETLRLAYERGFFDIPRRATAADLASELGVSRQAVSERLRRGYAALVERHVD
jgi:predicted DNA binding protein